MPTDSSPGPSRLDARATACGCAGFSRSELLRSGAAATAGRGLRAIEAGMPLPAGTGL